MGSHQTRNEMANKAMRLQPSAVMAFLWALVIYSVDLNIHVLANLQWYVSLVLIAPLLLLYPPRFKRLNVWLLTLPVATLLLAMLLSSLDSASPARSLVHVAKIVVVLLLIYPFFLQNGPSARAAFHAGALATYLNAGMLLLGLLSFSELAAPAGDGRWVTVLNRRGNLAQLGVSFFGFAAYGALMVRPLSLKRVFLVAACLLVLLLDGSRAAFLGLLLALAFLVVVLPREPAFTRSLQAGIWKAVSGVAVSVLLLITLDSFGFGSVFLDSAPIARLRMLLAYPANTSVSAYLQELDGPRYGAMLAALDSIREHPLVGSGLGTTVSDLEDNLIGIHNAYLQTWADLGLLGLLSYLTLTAGWIASLPTAIRRVRALPSQEEKSLYYGAISSLLVYCCWGLFHGMSVDASGWIYFIVPASLYLQLVRRRRRRPLRAPANQLRGPHALDLRGVLPRSASPTV